MYCFQQYTISRLAPDSVAGLRALRVFRSNASQRADVGRVPAGEAAVGGAAGEGGLGRVGREVGDEAPRGAEDRLAPREVQDLALDDRRAAADDLERPAVEAEERAGAFRRRGGAA